MPVRIGMGLFAVGVLAVVVIMVMFASGSHDLPLWLNLTAMLAPLGFAVGMVGVAVDARRSSRALARATSDQESDAGSQP
jgi:peptidoglycan/LPS O-acetylase OafA/YrhL